MDIDSLLKRHKMDTWFDNGESEYLKLKMNWNSYNYHSHSYNDGEYAI